MEITLNGRPREIPEATTVKGLIDSLGIHPSSVAVQVNSDIIKRDRYEFEILKAGDAVEVLTFTAGG
jgi:sulfur carrier protein